MKNFDWNQIPKCLVGTEPLEIGGPRQALGFAVTGGAASMGRVLSNAIDRSAHTPHSLAVFLSRRVYTCRQAHKRSGHWWGRLYNKCTGDHAYYIKLKGLHLIQALRVIDEIPQDQEIPVDANCAIRLDFATEMLHELKRQLSDKAN